MKKDPALEALFQQNIAPDINPKVRDEQIRKLSHEVRNMEYLPRQSFAEQILTQMSFISGWVWLAQACFLLFMFAVSQNQRWFPTYGQIALFCLTPALSLILTCEMSKSFSVDMWEMEAACRYNLAQILFLRLCILCGCDLFLLTGALMAYRSTGGALWQFCLYALLPFFLTAALSLYLLRRMGNRCSFMTMAAISLTVGIFLPLFLQCVPYVYRIPSHRFCSIIFTATFLALLLFFYNALRLCAQQSYVYDNRKDQNAWNLE